MKSGRLSAILLLVLSGVLLFARQVAANPATAVINGGKAVLENGKVELVFSADKVFKMETLRLNGHDMLPEGGSVTEPWKLLYRGTYGESPDLWPKNGYYKGAEVREREGGKSLVFTWQMVLSGETTYPVRMIVSLSDDAELPEWNIEAEMPEKWRIEKLEFPRIPVVCPPNAKAILSAGWGTEYDMTSTSMFNSRYPSCTGALQLLMMYNEEGAFYFSTVDKGASGKYLKVAPENGLSTFYSEIVASAEWTSADGKFSLPWATVVGYCKEGWQSAVEKWYRPFALSTEWGSKSIRERDIPEWMLNADVWIRPGHVNEETMAAVRKMLKYFGKGVGVHWYYWHKYPFDTNYPDYFPALDGFADMVRETQKLGGYVTPYINGRLWDPANESYKALKGYEASCRKSDGSLYTEVYASKVLNTVTCPSSDIWRNVQKGLVKRIQEELGTRGVYIDQIAAAACEPCYATNHNHPLGGGNWWHYAYRSLLKEMRTGCLKAGNVLTSEENAECYIDLFDMLLTVNTPHSQYVKAVPLFPLVYSDRCITSAYAYIPADLSNGVFRFENMRCLLWGSQLGWANPVDMAKPEAKTELKFLKDLADFRRKNHDLFCGGRFMGNIALEGDIPMREIPSFENTPVVQAAKWISISGEASAVIVNMDEVSHKVTLPGNVQVEVKGLDCMRVPIPAQ